MALIAAAMRLGSSLTLLPEVLGAPERLLVRSACSGVAAVGYLAVKVQLPYMTHPSVVSGMKWRK